MRKTLAVLATVAAVGATTVMAPRAEARGFGFGPGLAFGLAAGALAAGAYGAYGPYYGPHYYGYYGPRYRSYAYDNDDYAYVGRRHCRTVREDFNGRLRTIRRCW